MIAAIVVYLVILYALAWQASKRVHTVEEFVLAGRQLPLLISTFTLIATWFGAESMLTVANEVASVGIRRAMMDPVGIALCLALAGCFVAKILWRMQILTLGDFFRDRFGLVAEQVSSWILIPSYFGWIATQLMSLAIVLQTLLQWPMEISIFAVAIAGTGYCLLGGMLSVSWIDMFQMILIAVGLILVGYTVLNELGDQSLSLGSVRLWSNAPQGHWFLADRSTATSDYSLALGAIAIGALGNLPTQDLLQRILAAKSETIAARACHLAAMGYLFIGAFPVLIGIGAVCLDRGWNDSESDVLTTLAVRYLSYPAQVVFLLAITSAVLSTFASAVMSPSAIVAQNLVGPVLRRWSKRSWTDREQLWLQRVCIVVVVAVSLVLSLVGKSAYELLQASYAICFVSLTVPFLVGLYSSHRSQTAAVAAMTGGIAIWLIHFFLGWDYFLQPWLEDNLPIAQEVVAMMVSGIFYWLANLCWSTRRCGVRESSSMKSFKSIGQDSSDP
jgi:solute:Na+ symporter, SSS family